jgi:hypothetical protein
MVQAHGRKLHGKDCSHTQTVSVSPHWQQIIDEIVARVGVVAGQKLLGRRIPLPGGVYGLKKSLTKEL